MLTEKEVLERAFRELDQLVGKPVAETVRTDAPPLEQRPQPLRELADEQVVASGDRQATGEVWLSWPEWKATMLNRLFQEQGLTREPGHITAETVRHGLSGGLSSNDNASAWGASDARGFYCSDPTCPVLENRV